MIPRPHDYETTNPSFQHLSSGCTTYHYVFK